MRISAGTLRGRPVEVPSGVRPTSARTREALFDIWGERVPGSRFLELFAGSGAVALEALSRGAAEVVLVDRAPEILATARRNLERLAAAGRWSLHRAELPADLEAGRWRSQAFDLVFADPPYAFDGWESLLEAAGRLLEPKGELALEHPSRGRPPSAVGRLELDRTRVYGESALSFYCARASTRPSSV